MELRKRSLKKKNLLISIIGNESIHDLWIKDNRNYDVILICYQDEIYDKIKHLESRSLRIYRRNGFHFPLIKWLYNKYKLNYERFLFINHDIFITCDDINYCFDKQENGGVKIGHPAINPRNNPTGLLKQDKENTITWVNWIELMAVFIDKEAFDYIVDTFDENNTGYGYPELWRLKLNELSKEIAKETPRKIRTDFAVFDQIEIIHTRPVNSGHSIYKANNQTIFEAKDDMIALHKKYGIKQQPYKEYGKKLKRHLCSSVVIYSQDHWDRYMEEHLMTMPTWMEGIQVKTIPLPNKEYEKLKNDLKVTRELGSLVQAEFYYREGTKKEPLKYWDFSYVRNRAKSLATAQWIFSIDADERYIIQQHQLIFDILSQLPDNIGGILINNFSKDTTRKDESGLAARIGTGQVKIFRNREEIYWQDAVHETVSESIKKAGLIITESNITILHDGYLVDADEMKEKKSYRNLMLYVRNADLLESELHFKIFLHTVIDYKILTDKLKE